MKILTAEQMNTVDRKTTDTCGIPSLILMENAGFHLFDALDKSFEDLAQLNIAIICGKGNNGGDGMVLARQLIQRGILPFVVLLGDFSSLKGDAATNLNILLKYGYPVLEAVDEKTWQTVSFNISTFDIIVDAILGTGISKPLKGLYQSVVSDINHAGRFILSVDIPSGMVSDSTEPAPEQIWADLTVTFTAPKIAQILNQNIEAVGDLIVAPIGTPNDLLETDEHRLNLITQRSAAAFAMPRSADSHKGTFGHVALIAGSRGKAGAAGLTSLAALKTGSGLVTAIVPDKIQELVASYNTEVMTEGLDSTTAGTYALSSINRLLELLLEKDAAGIGPGLTTHKETVSLVREVVQKSPVPLVIDADALNAFVGAVDRLENENHQPLILTPHPGELSRLTGIPTPELLTNQLKIVGEFAQTKNLWVIFKTHRTLIATPSGQIFVSPNGNPGMATAGMGDVLTGILTSLVGQSMAEEFTDESDITAALCFGVYLHGLAGDISADTTGQPALVASDVIEALGESFTTLVEI